VVVVGLMTPKRANPMGEVVMVVVVMSPWSMARQW